MSKDDNPKTGVRCPHCGLRAHRKVPPTFDKIIDGLGKAIDWLTKFPQSLFLGGLIITLPVLVLMILVGLLATFVSAFHAYRCQSCGPILFRDMSLGIKIYSVSARLCGWAPICLIIYGVYYLITSHSHA